MDKGNLKLSVVQCNKTHGVVIGRKLLFLIKVSNFYHKQQLPSDSNAAERSTNHVTFFAKSNNC